MHGTQCPEIVLAVRKGVLATENSLEGALTGVCNTVASSRAHHAPWPRVWILCSRHTEGFPEAVGLHWKEVLGRAEFPCSRSPQRSRVLSPLSGQSCTSAHQGWSLQVPIDRSWPKPESLAKRPVGHYPAEQERVQFYLQGASRRILLSGTPLLWETQRCAPPSFPHSSVKGRTVLRSSPWE